jgi:hypothetical protein
MLFRLLIDLDLIEFAKTLPAAQRRRLTIISEKFRNFRDIIPI